MDKVEKEFAFFMVLMIALAFAFVVSYEAEKTVEATRKETTSAVTGTSTEAVTESERAYSQDDLDRMLDILALKLIPSDADYARYDMNRDSMLTIDDLVAIRDIILASDPYRCIGEFTLTAYCPCEQCCGKWAEGRPTDDAGDEIVFTASGEVAKAGRTVAVDTSIISYGSIVVIDGAEYIAEDTGVKGRVIDIYFDRHEDAEAFGKQKKDSIYQGGQMIWHLTRQY